MVLLNCFLLKSFTFACSIFRMLCSIRGLRLNRSSSRVPVHLLDSQNFPQLIPPWFLSFTNPWSPLGLLCPLSGCSFWSSSLILKILFPFGTKGLWECLDESSVKEFQKPKLPILLLTAVIYVQKYCVNLYPARCFI